MSKSIEKEIRVGYEKLFNYMLLEKGVDLRKLVSPEDINTVMKQINNARMLNTDLDIFLNICKYLSTPDMIKITILSKKYMDSYYINIWGYIQSIHYPNSIIPYNDYIDIRHAISLDKYYSSFHYYYDRSKSFDQYNDLHLKEINIKATNNQNVNNLYDNINSKLMYFLTLFRVINSISDTNGVKYFTLKSAVDCRLYGFDPINDPVEIEIKRKWITGEYNEDPIYFDGDTEYTFIYETLYYDSDFRYEAVGPGKMIKWRKRPYYC
jgi:hypothetical protein